jgi:hypothetical protein
MVALKQASGSISLHVPRKTMLACLCLSSPATSGWHTALINSQEVDSGRKRNFKNFKKRLKERGRKRRIPQEIEEEFERESVAGITGVWPGQVPERAD